MVGFVFSSTITVIVSVFFPSRVLTVIFASPFDIAVIIPSSTVATFSLSEDHITVLSVAFAGTICADIFLLLPSESVRDATDNTTSVTFITGVFTLILHFAVNFPLTFTDTYVVPGPTAFTFPPSTVATSVSSDSQTSSVRLLASSGLTLYVSKYVSPTSIVSSLLLISIPVIASSFAETFTTHTASYPPSAETALIFVVPWPVAFTMPSFTVAIFLSSDDQVILLSVAFAGTTAAVILWVLPSIIYISL